MIAPPPSQLELPSDPDGDRWARMTVLAAVVGILSFLICEVCSLDVWWQITIGQDILRAFEIPTLDRYTVAGFGQPYHDSHWFFQVLLAGCHSALGMIGVQLFTIVLWGAILALVFSSCRAWVPLGTSAVLTYLAAMASIERFLPRPELFTFLGIAGMYVLLQRKAYRRHVGLAAIVGLQVVWANTHGLFVIGPFLVGSYWAVECVKKLKDEDSDIGALSRALVLAVGATLVSVFPIAGWKYAFLLFAEVGQNTSAVFETLGELSPTFGHMARSAPAFWFFLALLILGIGGAAQLIRKKRVSARHLILLGMAAAAMTGRRNTVLFAIVAAPMVAEALASFPPVRAKVQKICLVTAIALMLGWACYPLSGAYYLKMEIPARFGLGATPSFFPHELPSFLDSIAFNGTVLNSNTLGGFYVFHGFPERLPLTDGRWEVHDPKVLDSIMERSRQPYLWRSLVSEYNVQGIMLAHSSPEAKALVPDLQRSNDWRLVYLDVAASFWMKMTTLPHPPTLDISDPSILPDLLRADDGLILGSFLGLLDVPHLQIENLKRTLEFGFKRAFLLEKLANAQIKAGDYSGSEATFLSLLELNPVNTAALNELAFLSYQSGNLDRAEVLMLRAIEIEPANDEYRQNYERIQAAKGSSLREEQ